MFSFMLAILLVPVGVGEVDNVYSRSVPCCGMAAVEGGGTGGAGGSKTPRSKDVTTPGTPGIVCILCDAQLCDCVGGRCVNCGSGGNLTAAVPRLNELIEQRFADKKLAKRLTTAIHRVAGTIKDGKVDGPAHDRAMQQLVKLEKQISTGDRQHLQNIGKEVRATFKGKNQSK